MTEHRARLALISQVPSAKGGVPHVARFERTPDGDKTWIAMGSNLVGSTADLAQATMTFVAQSHGFLWTGTMLLSTTDSGSTWSEIQIKYS